MEIQYISFLHFSIQLFITEAVSYMLYYGTLFFFTLCMRKNCFKADKKEILFAGACGKEKKEVS